MYKLLIVDDEEFEREGMAQLIDWKQYEIEMVGTAWNGVDALRKTKMLRPDIILTDIKMPVMNGIELIRKVRESYPEIEFAVLSGYGEYEFTSQAMELGVRHYILKPCDESRIMEAVNKVKKDVDARREASRREKEYVNRVAPQARQQLFRNVLLERETVREEELLRLLGGKAPRRVRLLVFRSHASFDGLEEFVLGNILDELLEHRQMGAFVSTVVRNDAVIMIPDLEPETLKPIVRRIEREFQKIRPEGIRAAVSDSGEPGQIAGLYRQIGELFRIGQEVKRESLLHTGMFDGKKQDVHLLVDFDIVGKTQDYALLLQSLQLTFLRMQKRSYTLAQMRETVDWLLRWLYGESLEGAQEDPAEESGQSLLILAARQIFAHSAQGMEDDKEEQRYRIALEEIYRRFQDQKLCLHDLATEVLYINEDYFGRFFRKKSGKKFTQFLLDARILAAEQLMRLEPDTMVYAVAEMTGYAADGQYFAKTFKKRTGMTPSEYRTGILQTTAGEKQEKTSEKESL